MKPVSRTQNPTIDPKFVEAIAEGFIVQDKEIQNSQPLRRTIKELRETAIAKGEEPPEFVTMGGKVPYVDPDMVDAAQKTMGYFRDQLMTELHNANSSQEQHMAIMRTLRKSFAAHTQSGWPALNTQLLATAIEHGYEAYEEANKASSNTGAAVPINRAAQTFWKDAIKDVAMYATLAAEARIDLKNLTQAYIEKHGIEDAPHITSPSELAEWRYSLVKEVDYPAPNFEIEDPETYHDILATLMRDDIYGPYEQLFNGSTAPELAWFVGRTMDTLHKHQEPATKRPPILSVHDAKTPEGRLPKFYEKIAPPTPHVSFADTIGMMQDEVMQNKAMHIMNETLKDYPQTTRNPIVLCDAVRDFAKTHNLQIGEAESQSR